MFEYPDKAVNKYRRSWEEYFCWDSEHYALRVMRYAVCVMLHPSVHSVGAKSQLGVYCPGLNRRLSPCLRGLWTSSSTAKTFISRVYWLKSKRPANSLPCIHLSWPLELQRGYVSLWFRCFSQALQPIVALDSELVKKYHLGRLGVQSPWTE